MKVKVAGCLAVVFIFAGAAVVTIRGLKRLGHMLNGMTMEHDDLMT